MGLGKAEGHVMKASASPFAIVQKPTIKALRTIAALTSRDELISVVVKIDSM
jgi:hypothetical protein